MVARALDAGVNYFDTADVYASGGSEVILGEALKPQRNRVVISTKVGNRGAGNRELLHSGLSRRHILWSVDESLKRLGTDWIDIYTVHRLDPFTPLAETLDALDAVVRAGKVRYLAFSNWPAWRAAAAIAHQRAERLAPFSQGQMYYSLLGRDVERDTVAMMRHFGLRMAVWSPLAFGFLAGTYSREDMEKDENRFSRTDWLNFDRDKGFALLPVMRGIAEARGCSLAQLAIAWLLTRPCVDSVLLGATRLSQLDDNLGATEVELTAEDLATLDEATALAPLYPSSDWVEVDTFIARRLGGDGR